MVIILRFNNGYRLILFKVKNIIGLLRFTSYDKVPLKINSPISDFSFHRNMTTVPLRQNCRRYKLQFDIFFGHL